MSIARNVLYNIFNNVLNVVVPIVTVPYVSRVLGVEGVGVTGFVQNYVEIFAIFILLGIPLYGIREVGKCRDDADQRRIVVSELSRIILLSTIFFTAIYAVSIFTVPRLRAEWPFLAVAGTGLLFYAFNVDWYFTGRERLRVIVGRNLIVKLTGLAAIFLFVRERGDIIPYLTINVVLLGGAQVWSFFHMLRDEGRLKRRNLDLRRHIRPISILLLSTAAITIYTKLDTAMLGFLSTDTQVGYYSSVVKVSRMLLLIVTASATAVIPRLSHLYKERDRVGLKRMTDRSFGFMALLAPPMTIGSVVVAHRFVPLFFGSEFVGAIPSMIVVSWLILLIGLGNFYGAQSLLPAGREKEYARSVLVGTIVNFTLNCFFIPRWGALGASWASVLAEGGVTGMMLYYVLRHLPEVRPDYRPLVRSLVASLPMFVFAWAATRWIASPAWSLVTIVATSALTFFVIEFYGFKEASLRDIHGRIAANIHRKR